MRTAIAQESRRQEFDALLTDEVEDDLGSAAGDVEDLGRDGVVDMVINVIGQVAGTDVDF